MTMPIRKLISPTMRDRGHPDELHLPYQRGHHGAASDGGSPHPTRGDDRAEEADHPHGARGRGRSSSCRRPVTLLDQRPARRARCRRCWRCARTAAMQRLSACSLAPMIFARYARSAKRATGPRADVPIVAGARHVDEPCRRLGELAQARRSSTLIDETTSGPCSTTVGPAAPPPAP